MWVQILGGTSTSRKLACRPYVSITLHVHVYMCGTLGETKILWEQDLSHLVSVSTVTAFFNFLWAVAISKQTQRKSYEKQHMQNTLFFLADHCNSFLEGKTKE